MKRIQAVVDPLATDIVATHHLSVPTPYLPIQQHYPGLEVLTAVLHWAVSFLGRGRSERVSTFQQAYARAAVREYGDPFDRQRAAPCAIVAAASTTMPRLAKY